ncbi:MAG: hypothetical protein NDJ89_00115 [Oligoflexia bacterium]|nr:hypothetical protein [Oligoflexia bacterium]
MTLIQRAAMVLAAGVILFQVATLTSVQLNGDEALYMLLVEELRRIFSGNWPQLNPVIHYSGPFDFWILGSVYALLYGWKSLEASAWMVRIVPFVLFWAGVWGFAREVRRWSAPLSGWLVALLAISPLCLVYTKIAWQHSLLLGAFSLLVAEALRARRVGGIRWLRIGALAGLCSETHPTVFVGLVSVFLPSIQPLWADARRHPRRALGAVALFFAFAYPVLRNFPPPVSEAGERAVSLLIEFRNFANIITGAQPFSWMFHRDFGPDWLPISLFALLAAVLLRQLESLVRLWRRGEATELDRFLLWLWLSHFATAMLLLAMCYRGRSLQFLGHERYFFVLVPGWTLLQADAFRRFVETTRLRGRPWAMLALLGFVTLNIGWRFVPPTLHATRGTDPSLLAARWLTRNCPAGSCVGYAENFWNYWPIRFYTRDAIQVRFFSHNWKGGPAYPIEGKELAACWFPGSEIEYRGPMRVRFDIPPQAMGAAQSCATGVQAAFLGQK